MNQTRPLILALLLTPLSVSHSAPAQKPNIVYILADDLGYGDVQCLNSDRGKIPTPSLDRMASQGMTFTDAHSGSSVCTPTRYGVLTGRYAWRTRLQRGVLSDYVTPLIDADRLTLPALLNQNGYHTACIGKWHLGFTIESDDKNARFKPRRGGAPIGAVTNDGPVSRGFDHYFGFHHARMMKSLFEDDRVTRLVEHEDMLPLLTRHASDYIAERAGTGKPFFLYLALNSPHTPIVPSKEWRGKSGLGDYGDFVMETDWAVGEVLAAIERAGIADHTIVIATSDNGCSKEAGIDQLQAKGHYPSAQFRGSKADIWDGGHRMPFFLRWPHRVEAGSTCAQTVCHTDLMATCADILGISLSDGAGPDSVSILPALEGTKPVVPRPPVVHHSINGSFAIRDGTWKLELCAGSGGWTKPTEAEAKKRGLPELQLYNLETDIGETKNVQAEYPEIVERLTRELEQQVEKGRSTPGPPQKNDVRVRILKSAPKKRRAAAKD